MLFIVGSSGGPVRLGFVILFGAQISLVIGVFYP